MFASKTTTFIELIRGQRKDVRILVVRPTNDTRYTTDNVIISHDGDQIECESCHPDDLVAYVFSQCEFIDKLFIDEGHFFPALEMAVIQALDTGVDVVVSGIDLNYQRKPFENMQSLEKYAKTLIQCHATCMCGSKARFTMLRNSETKTESGDAIIVGGWEKYGVSCGQLDCDEEY